MANASPEPNTTPNSSIDHMFDLDLALTMVVEDYNSNHGVKSSGSLASSSPTHDQKRKSGLAPEEMLLSTFAAPPVGGVCTVCMEGFQSATIGKQIPCGHVYHEPCISKWLSLHHSCPLCRKNFSGGRQSSPAASLLN